MKRQQVRGKLFMKFEQPPTTKVLINQGHCEDYNATEELSEAYRELKRTDLGAYLVLADFDRDQARRNWVHDRRTGKGITSEFMPYSPPLSHSFPSNAKGQQQLAIAQLLIDGYNRQEIAGMLHLQYNKTCDIVKEIRAILADKA